MVQYIQLVGGDTVTEDARVAPARVVTIDTEGGNIRLHDGLTPGGKKLVPLDDLPEYEARLFNSYNIWGGGEELTGLSANFTLLGAGAFDFEPFSELLVGVPVYIATGASPATITVFDSDTETFRIGSGTSPSIEIPGESIATLVKLTTGIVVLLNVFTAS